LSGQESWSRGCACNRLRLPSPQPPSTAQPRSQDDRYRSEPVSARFEPSPKRINADIEDRGTETLARISRAEARKFASRGTAPDRARGRDSIDRAATPRGHAARATAAAVRCWCLGASTRGLDVNLLECCRRIAVTRFAYSIVASARRFDDTLRRLKRN